MAVDVFEIFAKLTLDTSDYDKGIDKGKEEANMFADVLSANLATKAIGMAIDGLKKLGDAAIEMGKQAVTAYADYEQLVGGIETLFKDSSDVVLGYAEEAYKTAGISANQYMEMATSFSGALIKSTGRGMQEDLGQMQATLDEEYKQTKRHLEDQYDIEKDYWDKKIKAATSSGYKEKLQEQRDEALKDLKRSNEDQLAELKAHNKQVLAEAEEMNQKSVSTAESLADAAELTQMAIIDMSDQANKYGKTVEQVSVTYQSLSRGIYTTLDNLFGGMFAGTKAGLEEMLDYAENYRAGLGETVTYTSDSYADIVMAIHDVSEALGVAGTTQDEAMNTVSGSLNQMKSAWKDLVAGLGNDKADLEKLIDNFFDAAENAWHRLEPVLDTILKNIWEFIEKGFPRFLELGVDIGKKIAKGILEGLATILLLPAAGILKLLDKVFDGGISDLMGTKKETNTYARASGGFVSAGQAYKVGEFGTEVFVPSTNGRIYNAKESASMLGGGVTINIQGDVYDDERSMRNKMKTAILGVMQEQVAYG